MDQEPVTPETLTAAVQSGQLSQKDFDSAIAKIAGSSSSGGNSPPGPVPPPVSEGVVILRDGELSQKDAATLAKDISELESSGKLTAEQAAKYRAEAGIVKSEPKPAALAEHERIHGQPATEFIIPPLDGVTDAEAMESRTTFTKALIAAEAPAHLANAIISQVKAAHTQSQRWNPAEREGHALDSMNALEKRYGAAELKPMMERGRAFLAHLDKAAPGIKDYLTASGALDHSPLVLSLFLGASEQWHKRQALKK